MSNINGYIVDGELKNDNSGYAKWGFGRRDGQEFFIKEFLSPSYPMDENILSKAQINKKREICKEFEFEKRVFYNQLNRCVTGNIITILDFFRFESKYYMTTEKVDAIPMSPVEISRFPEEQKFMIAKVILYCINSLHKHGIVHGDIKADNILFKKTERNVYTAKVIDFDSSFLEAKPPKSDEDFQGDMVYLAPESFLLIAEEEVTIDRKIDVFALGVLLHQYFCGELPWFDKSQYDYLFEAVLDGAEVRIDSTIPEILRNLLVKMLEKDPEARPEVEYVFNILAGYSPDRKIGHINTTNTEIKFSGAIKSTMGMGKRRISSLMEDDIPDVSVYNKEDTGKEGRKEPEKSYFKKADTML